MVKINKIYTRTGDQGTTHLVGGVLVAKSDPRVECYGNVDELNSHLGFIRTLAIDNKKPALVEKLAIIQNELFDVGAILACADKDTQDKMAQISPEQIKQLEDWIDEAITGLPELKSFVLPGGTVLNSQFHIARTVCRRAERSLFALAKDSFPHNVGIYLNRLSDLLFAFARHASHDANVEEYLWVPGKKAT